MMDFDHFDDECWNCGGEGYVAHCFEEYACMYPDEGCDLCMRRCEFCAAVAVRQDAPDSPKAFERKP
jgi:hypothetical protein